MICHNCEFPLDWDGFRPIVACEVCRAYRFVDTPDGSGECIISLNVPGESSCPCCRRRLARAAMDGLKVEYCAGCAGVLMDDATFAMFVRNRRAEFREAAQQSAIPVHERRLQHVNCPSCRNAMNSHPNYGPSLMLIDSCSPCGLVWLDCQTILAMATDAAI